jgi:hypothetical protein
MAISKNLTAVTTTQIHSVHRKEKTDDQLFYMHGKNHTESLVAYSPLVRPTSIRSLFLVKNMYTEC